MSALFQNVMQIPFIQFSLMESNEKRAFLLLSQFSSIHEWDSYSKHATHFFSHSQFSLFALFQIVTQNIILHINRLQVLAWYNSKFQSANSPYLQANNLRDNTDFHPSRITFSHFPLFILPAESIFLLKQFASKQCVNAF